MFAAQASAPELSAGVTDFVRLSTPAI